MSINKISTLSFSLYFNKGAYAVLLGSGISRPAHIPSTWEVENELIERLASTQGVSDIEDWHRWYKEQYKGDADYSSLLTSIVNGILSILKKSGSEIKYGYPNNK